MTRDQSIAATQGKWVDDAAAIEMTLDEALISLATVAAQMILSMTETEFEARRQVDVVTRALADAVESSWEPKGTLQ